MMKWTGAKKLFSDGLIFAGGNRGKYEEVKDLFRPMGIDIKFGPEVGDLEVDETGSTYAANARLKARSWALFSGLPSLADDSGVEAGALGWKPGIHSARMASDDPGRVAWMLDALGDSPDRRGRYVAAFALYFPKEEICLITEGECLGEIVRTPAGTGGFGYDPIFAPLGYEGTFGEIPDFIKRKISHRAIAGYRMLDILSRLSMVE